MRFSTHTLLSVFLLLPSLCGAFQPNDWAIIHTDREDGRHVSSRGVVHAIMKDTQPTCAFQQNMAPSEFPAWQARVQHEMRRLMKHPPHADLPQPQLIKRVQRDGYRIEKWESYPLTQAVVPFLVLVPGSATPQSPAPMVFCIPGSGQPKETLAGEQSYDLSQAPAAQVSDNAMALHYVRQGWVAIVVDNAGTGEEGDAEQAAGRAGYDDENLARFLLEIDWSWLGYTSYTDQCILDWAKTLPYIQKERIILSGFSLGTEPLMVLGLLNPDIYAFVYNDFLCRTRERIQVLTKPNRQGARPAPNSIRHLIPGFLQQFDFPDIVAALAPRPVICTEGGLDRDFSLVKKAFELAGAPENFSFHHQPKFARAEDRWQGDHLPEGLDRDRFFRLANVDPRNHFFKKDLIIPWLHRLLLRDSDHTPTQN